MTHDPNHWPAVDCGCRSCAVNRRRHPEWATPAEPAPLEQPAPELEPASPATDESSRAPTPRPSRRRMARINLHTTVPKAEYERLVGRYKHSLAIENAAKARRRQAVIDLHALGVGIRPIAAATGLDKTTVDAWLREHRTQAADG